MTREQERQAFADFTLPRKPVNDKPVIYVEPEKVEEVSP